jgi:hypothetical protein
MVPGTFLGEKKTQRVIINDNDDLYVETTG